MRVFPQKRGGLVFVILAMSVVILFASAGLNWLLQTASSFVSGRCQRAALQQGPAASSEAESRNLRPTVVSNLVSDSILQVASPIHVYAYCYSFFDVYTYVYMSTHRWLCLFI